MTKEESKIISRWLYSKMMEKYNEDGSPKQLAWPESMFPPEVLIIDTDKFHREIDGLFEPEK